nr:cytochrome P450 [Isodon lophanthoides var. gerardianus]
MELVTAIAVVVVVLAVVAWPQLTNRKLPPGPYPLPIVGNVFQVWQNPHQSFSQLSKKYGPIMSIRLGTTLNVVVSSPEIAKVVLTQQWYTNRPELQAIQVHGHDKLSMVFLPTSHEKWLAMRKICKEHVFGNHSLQSSQHLRQQKLHQLLGYVQSCCDGGRVVDIREATFTTMLNLMSATMFSSDDSDFDSPVTLELKEIVEGMADAIVAPNSADFFPFLKPFDPQGVRRRAKLYLGRLLHLVKGYLDQRLESRRENPTHPKPDDLLETLVDATLGSEYNLKLEDITHLLLDLYGAGTETTTVTIEWVLSELLLHPDVYSKVKDELRNIVGDRKIMEEADISRLPYLQAVVKEVLRLHPPAPLMLPHKAVVDTEINGYFIPKHARLFVNVWSIGRDPSIWPNPETFQPQRFLNTSLDYKGQNFELLPFGSGRRICPGLPLAHRVVHATVAALIHNFDWKFAPGAAHRNKELFTGVLRREAPLMAIPLNP